MKLNISIGVSVLLVLDLFLLIILGKSYTTLILINPFFYARDLVLLAMTLLCFPHFKFTKRIKSIELLFLIAILYLMLSFCLRGFENTQIILRQFMVFGYGICFYVIMNTIFINRIVNHNFCKYLVYFGFGCLFVQIIYIPYLFVYFKINPFFERSYFSPIIMMGLFTVASYILVNIKSSLIKHALFLAVFFVSFTTGHDSTYLGLVVIYTVYVFVISSKNQQIIISVFLLVGTLLVFATIPSFTDVNVKWRLLFWKDSTLRIINNYIVLGEGFGIPYTSDEALIKLNSLYPDVPFSPKITEDNKYLFAPHNSFLSMAIHIGVLSIIFLFYPICRLFYNKRLLMEKEILFLFLSLLGMVVFSAFNVILELPHSSSIFWIVLFGLIFKLSERSELPTKE